MFDKSAYILKIERFIIKKKIIFSKMNEFYIGLHFYLGHISKKNQAICHNVRKYYKSSHIYIPNM